jgi:hypothetical protein
MAETQTTTMTTTTTALSYVTLTSKLGVHVASSKHPTRRAAETKAKLAIRTGAADSAAVWTDGDWSLAEPVAYFGSGR